MMDWKTKDSVARYFVVDVTHTQYNLLYIGYHGREGHMNRQFVDEFFEIDPNFDVRLVDAYAQ